MFKKVNNISDVLEFRFYQNLIAVWHKELRTASIISSEDYSVVSRLKPVKSLHIFDKYLVAFGLELYDLNNQRWIENLATDGYSFELPYQDEILCKKLNQIEETFEFFLFSPAQKEYRPITGITAAPGIAFGNYLITRVNWTSFAVLKDFAPLWESDLSDAGRHLDIFGKNQEGRINAINIYKDSVLVVAGNVIRRYDLATGSIIWELKIQKGAFPHHLVIDGDMAYSNGGAGYLTIDLTQGKLNPRVGDLKPINIEGKTVFPLGRKLVLQEGLLWHSISDSGVNVIAAIQPQTGEYVWYQPVDLYGWIEAPQFHHNKMYILSSEGELQVFERQ